MLLSSGVWVKYTGEMGIARDRGLQKLIEEHQVLPSVLFFAGPTLKGNSKAPLGSCGPTSISRMLPFLPSCKDLGVRLIVSKGMSKDVLNVLQETNLAYGIAPGGAGAFYGVRIERVLKRKYEELGPEAFFLINVKEFPFYVFLGGEVDGYFEQIQ
ncbi:fumarate hydratase C-terminal domain-containing protein [Coprothermobacter platensis]|uniref:fumarate hydratase C-terminal domain-containing protein n=1 Tax=Coprothermobacter platensis TaxID=108819 RepID=UPI00036F532A|nr:fumarate hydratase C-terminal domain-containing protein [Coprothermobacter platensis]